MVRVKQPIDFSRPNVQAVRLAEHDAVPPIEGEAGWLVGMGAIGEDLEQDTTIYPDRLQGAVVTLQDSTRFSPLTEDERSAVIARGPDGVDACQADSGSPLLRITEPFEARTVHRRRYRDEPQLGAVSMASFHSELWCGDTGVYVSVPLHRLWIDAAMRGEDDVYRLDHCAFDGVKPEIDEESHKKEEAVQAHCSPELREELKSSGYAHLL